MIAIEGLPEEVGPVLEVKFVGHIGNSYPGDASIREGRCRIFQPESVRIVHIM